MPPRTPITDRHARRSSPPATASTASRQHLAAARQGRSDPGQSLAAQGFATAAFVSSFVLSSPSAYRGFAHYDDRFEVPQTDEAVSLSQVPTPRRQTIAAAERWLTPAHRDPREAHRLWIDLYDPHVRSRAAASRSASQFAGRLYDGEVARIDTLLGRLRASLEARGLWDEALVVVTADHGEALGKHGEEGPRLATRRR